MNSQAASRWCTCLIFFFFPTAARENLEGPTFEPGILYQYQYTLDNQIGFLSHSSMQGSKLWAEALVDVQLLWKNVDNAMEQLLQIQVQGIYEEKAGSALTLELKRGLISLLQFQTHSGTVTEDDITGRCQVTYTIAEDYILKTKDLRDCIRPIFGFKSVNKIFGMLWQPMSKSLYSMKGHLLESALSEENHTVSLLLKSSVGINITSRQHLKLVTQMPGSKELPGKSLLEALATVLSKPQSINIASEPFKRVCTQCPTLRTYLKTVATKKFRMDLSRASTTWHFFKVVQMLRDAKKKDILLLLKKAPEDMLPLYVEAAVAAQSPASLTALSEFLNFGSKKQIPLVEKFLYAAAFSPRPTKELLHLILDKLSGKKLDPVIWETGNIVTGSLIGKLCQRKLCELQEVRLSMDTMLQKLKSAKKDSERVTYLLSLKGTLLPESIPIFLHYAEEGSSAVSATALSALQSYSAEHFSATVKRKMKRIFHQVKRHYSKVSRLTAAEILLDNDPSPMDFINILLATKEFEPEASRFLLSKIQSIVLSHHHPTRKAIKEALGDPQINNYYFLSSKVGSSIFFSGPLSVTSDMNVTFGLELLFSDIGLLRKSVTSFNILSHGHQFQAAQVAIEAKGVENILGGGSTNEEEELMAGMSATLLNVQLRPVAFFEGYADLMSKVLMGSGSPTTVVKGNVLLMDHQQAIPLQSGLQTVITLQGGLGLDVSADINVNMWEQEFRTGIKTSGALAIDVKAEMDASFFQATVKSQTEMETAISFNTAAQLSDMPLLMCLQFTEEEAYYREIFLVSESSANHSITIRKGRWTTIPGHEVPLHTANSEMCKMIHTGL